jgi:hypothetical protein
MTTPQPWRFLEPCWYVRDVLGWLTDRDPKRFGRIVTRAEVGAAARYNKPARKDHNPVRTLLHAFQHGRLLGFRDGQSVLVEFWSTKSLTDIRNDFETRVRRTDVLVLWPETWKWSQAIVWAMWRDEELVALCGQDSLSFAERHAERIRAGLPPAGSEQELRKLLRSGRITARGQKEGADDVEPAAADAWSEWAGMPSGWGEDEITFDAGEMRRELPYISEDARPKRSTDTQRFQSRHSQHIWERWRREWIDRFAAKQRQIRRWISFVEIADASARAGAPTSISEEDEARSLAYRRLVESMSRGEFEKNGRSRVLLLLPYLHASVPPHRLTREYFLAMVDAYGVTEFTNGSGLVRDHLWFCWLPSELCREWFKRHLLTWPDEFNPQHQTLGAQPGGREQGPRVAASESVPDAIAAEKKRRRGRNPGDGSKNDHAQLDQMLHLIAGANVTSPNAAALQIVEVSRDRGEKPAHHAHRRLSKKFIERYGPLPLRSTWGDVCRRIVEKLQMK